MYIKKNTQPTIECYESEKFLDASLELTYYHDIFKESISLALLLLLIRNFEIQLEDQVLQEEGSLSSGTGA